MAGFAGRTSPNTTIELVPGAVMTFRLPTVTPGSFMIRAAPLPFATPIITATAMAAKVAAGDAGGVAAGLALVGNIGPGGGQPQGNTGVLLMDLLHGDQVVQSGTGLHPQDTQSDADGTWQLRLQLAPGTPDVQQPYPFAINMTYPSALPILTRRIPLDAIQLVFDKNWNGKNYFQVNINDNKLFLNFSPEIGSYYHLSNEVLNLPVPWVTLQNVQRGPIHFGTGSSDSPFDWIKGRFPYIQLDIPFTHSEPGNQIEIDLPLGLPSIQLADFSFTFKFYMMAQAPNFMIATRFESRLLDVLPGALEDLALSGEFNDLLQQISGQIATKLTTGNPGEDMRAAVQRRVDGLVPPIAAAVAPWLVGAAFDFIGVHHEPATAPTDPPGGFIVVDYVGQEPPAGLPGLSTSTTTPPSTPSTNPFLFPDQEYVPRGDGDDMWKPPAPTPLKAGPPPLVPSTTSGTLADMDHIVVVMMENRSFDHMLGYLSLEGGRKDIDGLSRGPDGNLVQFNYFNGHFYYPEPITDTAAVRVSPGHGHLATKRQMADGMKHFVSNYARTVGNDPAKLWLVMGYYGAKQLPVYDLVAREFAICDRWFSSHIGPTWPNRFVSLTGDLNRDTFGEPETDTPVYADLTPVETTTLFDLLSDSKVSWHYFQNRFGTLRAYTKYTFDMTNVTEFDDPVNGFAPMVLAGKLPSVTFIDPAFGDLPPGNDDAPPCDLRAGQSFIETILHTLFGSSNPSWDRTMLIVCYDEHGGFYDHVIPPDSGIPLLGLSSGKLGPRVPAFVVSSLTPPASVLHDVFDHSAIAATILRRFCSPHPPHMSARVTAARDLRGAISLKSRRDLRPMFDRRIAVAMSPAPLTADLTSTSPIDDDHALIGAIGLMVG